MRFVDHATKVVSFWDNWIKTLATQLPTEGAALVQLDRWPVLAGILFGFLAYKPQIGLLIPVVLAAKRPVALLRQLRAAAVGLLALATTLAFGPHVWQAFLDCPPASAAS